jgi:hypothetical protein
LLFPQDDLEKIRGFGSETYHQDKTDESATRLFARMVRNTVKIGRNEPEQVSGLVSLVPADNCDQLTMWIKTEFMPFWTKLCPKSGSHIKVGSGDHSSFSSHVHLWAPRGRRFTLRAATSLFLRSFYF